MSFKNRASAPGQRMTLGKTPLLGLLLGCYFLRLSALVDSSCSEIMFMENLLTAKNVANRGGNEIDQGILTNGFVPK